MKITSISCVDLIRKGVNEKFAQILTNPENYHPDLGIHIGKTDWDYHIPDGVKNIVPLWDVNADSYVRWERNGITEYVWLFHDDPNWSLAAISEQGIMAVLWNSWCEFQETDDECRKFADAIGFKYCEEALELWKDDYDRFQNWIKQMKD